VSFSVSRHQQRDHDGDKSEHRNLTKAQQAMRLALLYPEPEKGGRGKKGNPEQTSEFSGKRLQQARSVLAFSRELALAVRDGSRKLDEALAEVKAADHHRLASAPFGKSSGSPASSAFRCATRAISVRISNTARSMLRRRRTPCGQTRSRMTRFGHCTSLAASSMLASDGGG
jgi:hypothetical protein